MSFIKSKKNTPNYQKRRKYRYFSEIGNIFFNCFSEK